MAATTAVKSESRWYIPHYGYGARSIWDCRHWSYEPRNWGRWLPLPLQSQNLREMANFGLKKAESEGDDRYWDYESRNWGTWPPLGLGTQKVREMATTGTTNAESERDNRHGRYKSRWERCSHLTLRNQEERKMTATGITIPKSEGDGCHRNYEPEKWRRYLEKIILCNSQYNMNLS
jgi:hypothetical protein